MNLPQAYQLANDLIDQLQPHCIQAEVAGSVRRGKPEVKDIEIVCLAAFEERHEKNLFGEVINAAEVNHTHEDLPGIMQQTGWVIGDKDGPRYKQLRHITLEINLDLFIVPDPREWGAVYLVRTGPAEFNKALFNWLLRKGMHLSGNLLHYHEKPNNPNTGKLEGCRNPNCPTIIPTPTEEAFLQAVGLPWIDPEYRTPEWVRHNSKLALGLPA